MPPGSTGARVFISYRSEPPDLHLARELSQALEAAGHRPFMAGESIRLGEKWPARIDEELAACDYFLLLLSRQAAASEMVLEEVRRARALQDQRGGKPPVILPIRVDLPLRDPLNYDLSGHLGSIQQREWRSEADHGPLLAELLAIVAGGSGTAGGIPAAPPRDRSLPLPDGPPLPVAEPELPGGQVDIASLFYVERPPIESSCYQEISRPGALIRIKAPRQMGKTSLMARVLRHAETLGHRTVPLSFQLADGSVFSELDNLLRWFCSSVTWALDLPDRVEDFWHLTGSKVCCTNYFERYLLPQAASPLTLGLDEVDLVFQSREVAANFLGLLRAWNERAKSTVLWKSLRLVIVHSTEVYIPLHINQSPFNVGKAVELPELTSGQVLDLAQRHGLTWPPETVDRLMTLVGGHPFLVRIALYGLARGEVTLDQLLATAGTEAGLYSDHLRRHLWNLETHPELGDAFRQVVASQRAVRLDSERAFKLNSMGLVSLQGNDVRPRCDLYRTYFQDRLRP